MNNWFINLLISIGVSILFLWVDVNTFIFNYGLDKITLLVICFLTWIVLNQHDILRELKDKEIKK